MPDSLLDRDATIYHEMMAHIPLFAHRSPEKVAIIDDLDRGIEREVLKHTSVSRIWQFLLHKQSGDGKNTKIAYCYGNTAECLVQIVPGSLDVLIINNHHLQTSFDQYFALLNSDGILIQQSDSPFNVHALKNIHDLLKKAGFGDVQVLHFPQPNFAHGWRAAVMAIKQGNIKRPREKAIFTKEFSTRYYNLDVHKAAFALPEFMCQELHSQHTEVIDEQT